MTEAYIESARRYYAIDHAIRTLEEVAENLQDINVSPKTVYEAMGKLHVERDKAYRETRRSV